MRVRLCMGVAVSVEVHACARACAYACVSMYYAHIHACVCVHNLSCEYACLLLVSVSVYVCMCFVWDYVCECARRGTSLSPVLNEFVGVMRACV